MAAFYVGFAPGGFKHYTTTISFLGSILETVSVSQDRAYPMHDRGPFFEKLRKIDEFVFELPPPAFTAPVPGGIISSGTPEKKISYRLPVDERPYPGRAVREKTYSPAEALREDMLVRREKDEGMVLYRPELEHLPFFLSDFLSSCVVEVKFTVTPSGTVMRPECVRSSGIPEVDEDAIRNIRQWQYYPAPQSFAMPGEFVVKLHMTPRAATRESRP
jgi:TonB family protein